MILIEVYYLMAFDFQTAALNQTLSFNSITYCSTLLYFLRRSDSVVQPNRRKFSPFCEDGDGANSARVEKSTSYLAFYLAFCRDSEPVQTAPFCPDLSPEVKGHLLLPRCFPSGLILYRPSCCQTQRMNPYRCATVAEVSTTQGQSRSAVEYNRERKPSAQGRAQVSVWRLAGW